MAFWLCFLCGGLTCCIAGVVIDGVGVGRSLLGIQVNTIRIVAGERIELSLAFARGVWDDVSRCGRIRT
jgi:hypothetical protein